MVEKLTSSKKSDLIKKAAHIRRRIVEMICKGGSGHLGGAMSCVEVLVTLYFEILRLDPHNPYWEERDRFILSAGHKCLTLYVAMALRGYFDEEKLFSYGSMDSPLPGHPDRHLLPGIEANTGSLGHGLAIGGGIALSGKMDGKDWKVYVLLGDGEAEEGTVWESAAAASHYKLDNLVAIVDKNKLQLQGPTREVMNIDPLGDRWRAFGWQVREIDGHNFDEIFCALSSVPFKKGSPSVIISHTIKGKGVSFAENVPVYHQWKPTPDEYERALKEVREREEELCQI